MRPEQIENNAILKKSLDFSVNLVEYCELLAQQKRFVVGNQLLKSGTSIGANAMEAQNSESKADFIHKMKIAAKEADETQYWLLICSRSKDYPDATTLSDHLQEIQ